MSAASVRELARAGELVVALDFDGTLAPRRDDPMACRMLPAARAAVDALARLPRTTVALVSGRSLADLKVISEHAPDSPIHLAASHGAEFWHAGDPEHPASSSSGADDALRHTAEQAVRDLDGVWIEPKTFGFAVHTRRADDAATRTAHARIEELMAREAPGWRRRTGFDILEYASRAEGKDTAVAALRQLAHADAVLFAGDDVTDEDALASLGPADLGVHVGDGETAASLSVPRIDDLAALLAELARERAHVVGARE